MLGGYESGLESDIIIIGLLELFVFLVCCHHGCQPSFEISFLTNMHTMISASPIGILRRIATCDIKWQLPLLNSIAVLLVKAE